jgi:acyl-CoA thioesterase FadM
MHTPSLQDTTAPEGICYGCGGSNPHGLHIQSRWDADGVHVVAEQREPGSLPRIDCVTGHLGIKFIKPTPLGVTLTLRARVEGDVGRKSRVVCEVYAGDVLTAIGDSVFVRVDTGQLAAAAHGRNE